MLSVRIWIARTTFVVLDETDLVEKTGFVGVQLTCNREAVGKQLREQGVLQWINSRVRRGDAKRNVTVLQGSVTVGDHQHMSTCRLDTLQNCYVEVQTCVVRSKHDDRQIWIEDSQRPMDKVNRGETLCIDIARLLQLQGALQGIRVAIACAQHDKVIGERVAQCLLTYFFFSLDDASQTLEDCTDVKGVAPDGVDQKQELSLIHISEPTRLGMISYAVFCLKKKKNPND